VRAGASGVIGRDAQGAATSGLRAVISLSAHIPGEQVQPSAKHYKLAAGRPDRWSVVLAKIGDGLELRRWHQGSGYLGSLSGSQTNIEARIPNAGCVLAAVPALWPIRGTIPWPMVIPTPTAIVFFSRAAVTAVTMVAGKSAIHVRDAAHTMIYI
jgi:hypothetical protein